MRFSRELISYTLLHTIKSVFREAFPLLPVSHEPGKLLGHEDNGEVNNFGVSDEKGCVGVTSDSFHHVVKKCVLRGN